MKPLMIVLLLILTISIASCSSDTTTSPNTTTEPQEDPPNANEDDPSDFEPTQEEPELIVDASEYEAREGYTPNQLTKEEFKGILQRRGPYTVTLSGEDSQNGAYDITWYVNRSGIEYRAFNTRYIENEDGNFVCTFEGRWSCEQETMIPYSRLEASVRYDPDSFPIRKTGVRPYANTQASCYVTELEDASMTLCLEESGAPMMVSIEDGSYTSSFVATRYEDSVPENAFTLPGPLV